MLELLLALLLVGLERLEFLFELGLRIVRDVHGGLVVAASLCGSFGLLLLDHVGDLLALLLQQAYLLMLKRQLLGVLPILVLEILVHVLGLSHLVVKLVELVTVLLVFAPNVVERLVLLLRHPFHDLSVPFEPLELLRFVLELILKPVNGVDVVGGLKLLPHFRYFLLQLYESSRLLLNLLVLVLKCCVRFQLTLNLGSPLLLKLSDLAIHFVDDLKEFGLKFLINLDHSFNGGIPGLRWLQRVPH